MSDIQARYKLWDEFLKEWPKERLATMTLDEYTKAGSTDTFSRWLDDSRLGRPGFPDSIKFGVYARASSEKLPRHPHSETHVWHESLGATADEAFQKVRAYIVQIAALAAAGDLDGIDAFEHPGLQEVIKWKIASLYQNRQQPIVVNIFTREPLAAFTGIPASQSMAALQRATLELRPEDMGILEFWRLVWEEWESQSQRNQTSASASFAPAPGQRPALVPGVVRGGIRCWGPGKCLTVWQYCHTQPWENLTAAHMRSQSARDGIDGYNESNAVQEMYRYKKWVLGDAAEQKGQGVPRRAIGLTADLAAAPAAVAAMQEKITTKKDGVCQRIWQYCHNEITAGRTPTVADVAAACGSSPEASTAHRQYLEYVDAAWSELEKLGVAPISPAPTPAGEQLADSNTCTNRIYYGPPGTGKTYTLNDIKRGYEERYGFVTFHQSYGYEEFIEGLRPRNTETGEVVYEVRPGAFKKLCKEARDNPGQRFAMLIDEINRGNISKIFGELITLIEPDKREGAENAVTVTLPYSGELFSVPANVDIFGTMNTADRSLALLDTALRRRFEFVPLLPDTGALAGLKVGEIDVPGMLERINERIEVLYDCEHCIGHAYFMALNRDPSLEALAAIFRNRILPLLEEYFFEDWHKIRLVLGDNQKPEEHQFVRKLAQDLSALFGSEHELDGDTTRRRYTVQESAFNNPAAYIGIYNTPAA